MSVFTSAVGRPVDGRARELSEREYTAVAVVAALVAVLGLLGFVNSFAGVAAAARPSFGALAFTVPIGIDVGIAVFAALDITLARLDMRMRWLRLVPWALTAATVYLNVARQHDGFGMVAHAVLPCLWVLAVEIAAHVIRVRAQLVAGARMDAIRRSRWLLAPLATARLWRRMVLWEIRSYPDALARERDRLLARTALQDRYGRLAWRWKAPRRQRALYRLGELVPATDAPALDGPSTDAQTANGTSAARPSIAGPSADALDDADGRADGPHDECSVLAATDPEQEEPAPVKSSDRTARSSARGRSGQHAAADLMPLGRQIAADLEAGGQALTRDSLAAALREAGHTAGNARVGALLARLKSETPTDLENAPAEAMRGEMR